MSERETGNSNLREGVDLRGSVSRLNVFIGGTAAIIGIIYGYDLGAIAAAILFLEPDLGLSTFMVSVVTATVVLGQLFGAFSAGSITNRLGRKRTMVGIALGYVIFAALQGVAPNEWFLIAARFLLGFTIGVSIVTAPSLRLEASEVP
jgi:MFS transporter, SP family, galactose:H+ symporter